MADETRSEDNSQLLGPGTTRVDPAKNPTPFGPELEQAWATPKDLVKDLSKSEAKDIAMTVRRDLPITVVSTNWTVEAIRNALSNHMLGLFNESAMLVDAIVGDDRVQATLGSRTAGLFGQPSYIKKAESDDPQADVVLEAFIRAWKICGQQSVLSSALKWAVMMGFALFEIRWDTSVTPWQPYLKPWHPQYIYYRWDLRKFVAITMTGPVEINPGDGKWVLYCPHGDYRGWIEGAVRAVATPWLIRQLAYRDWARYSERHGLPMLKAIVPAAGDVEQKKRFVNAMANLGQETVVMLPQGVDGQNYDMQLLEARDRSWESFKALIERCDSSIVLPILWQNLTTEVKEGSFAAARVHGDVRQNAIEFDEQTLSEAIYQQLARPFAAFNFGNPDLAPHVHWNIEPPEDQKTQMEILATFANSVKAMKDAGFEFDIEAVAKEFGIKLGSVEAASAPETQTVEEPADGT